MHRKFKRTSFMWNIYFYINHVNFFTLIFDLFDVFLLNKSILKKGKKWRLTASKLLISSMKCLHLWFPNNIFLAAQADIQITVFVFLYIKHCLLKFNCLGYYYASTEICNFTHAWNKYWSDFGGSLYRSIFTATPSSVSTQDILMKSDIAYITFFLTSSFFTSVNDCLGFFLPLSGVKCKLNVK